MGNHESDWPGTASNPGYGDASGGECGVCTFQLLPMPVPATTNKPWWSYDVGLIHFVGMSTEHDFSVGSEQYKWIETDLAHTNRTLTPWVVFSGHRSMYVDSSQCCVLGDKETCAAADMPCKSGSDIQVMSALQDSIEPLLFQYRVNLAFAGHFHNVQRQSAVYENKVVQEAERTYDSENNVVWYHNNPQATVWMVIGTAGNGPFDAQENYTWSERYWNNLFGYALVSAVNSTHLDWKFVNSANDVVVDRMSITQDFQPWSVAGSGSKSSGWNSLSDAAQGGIIFAIVFFCTMLISALVYALYRRQTEQTNLAVGSDSPGPNSSPFNSARSPMQDSPIFKIELNDIA